MKKLTLILGLLLFTISYVSAADIGCCCEVLGGVATGDFNTVFSIDQCESPEDNNTWIFYSNEFDDNFIDPAFMEELNTFCSDECHGIVIEDDGDEVTPDLNTVSGFVYNNSLLGEVLAGASVTLHDQNSYELSLTADDGSFSFSNVPNQDSLRIITSHSGCFDNIRTIQVDSDETIAIVLNCSSLECSFSPVDVYDLEPGNGYNLEIIPEEADINLLSNDCWDEDIEVLIRLCVGSGESMQCRYVPYSSNPYDLIDGQSAIIDLSSHNLGFGNGGWLDSIEDQFVKFSIGFRYANEWFWGGFDDMQLGSPECWVATGEICYDNKVQSCNDDLELEIIDDCNPDHFCYYESNNNAECAYQHECDACNSVNRMFPDLFRLFGENDEEIPCPELVENEGLSSCFMASSRTAQDYYDECSKVESCYDYTTRTSCTDEPCRTVGGNHCEWKSVTPNVLGRGICVPVGEEIDCTQCKQENGCTQQICEGLGDCSYGERDNKMLCLPIDRFACRDYTNKIDCVNSTNVSVELDVNYNSSGERTGGSHEILQRSQDKYGKGVCLWGEDSLGNPACVKDADGDGERDSCLGGYLDVPCESDSQAPRTILPFSDGDNVALTDITNLDETLVVIDNMHTDDWIDTYVCLVPEGQDCYPNLRPVEILEDPPLVEDWYTLRFYSEDPSHNLEEVREITLLLADVSLPGVVDLNITG